MDRRLRAQLEHLRDDDRLRERARRAAELTLEERLALTYRLGRAAIEMLESLPTVAREQAARWRDVPGAGAEVVLRRLASIDRAEPR